MYNERVEPCKYTGYLIFGIFMAIMSILMMVHIFNHIALIVNNKTVNPFLDKMLQDIQASKASFTGIIVFCYLGYYFLLCAQMGNIKIGLRFY